MDECTVDVIYGIHITQLETFSPSRARFHLTNDRGMCGRCFKSEVSHSSQQVRLLKWLRERRGKERARFAHVGPAVSTDGDDWCARVFVVSAFDVPRSAFTIDCGYGVKRLGHTDQKNDVVTHRLAYAGPSGYNQTLCR